MLAVGVSYQLVSWFSWKKVSKVSRLELQFILWRVRLIECVGDLIPDKQSFGTSDYDQTKNNQTIYVQVLSDWEGFR